MAVEHHTPRGVAEHRTPRVAAEHRTSRAAAEHRTSRVAAEHRTSRVAAERRTSRAAVERRTSRAAAVAHGWAAEHASAVHMSAAGTSPVDPRARVLRPGKSADKAPRRFMAVRTAMPEARQR
jgi:hypothetical protein